MKRVLEVVYGNKNVQKRMQQLSTNVRTQKTYVQETQPEAESQRKWEI